MAKRVNTILDHFAKRVSTFRLTRGWTQERLAHEMGISRNYICMIEGGRVPKESVVKLFEALENAPLHLRSELPQAARTHPVRAARQAAGMTIKDLAAATQYKIGQLQAVEEDRARVSPQMAAALDTFFSFSEEQWQTMSDAAYATHLPAASAWRGRSQ